MATVYIVNDLKHDRKVALKAVGVRSMGYRFPRLSPHGRLLAVTVDPRPSDLWIVDLELAGAVPQATEQHERTVAGVLVRCLGRQRGVCRRLSAPA